MITVAEQLACARRELIWKRENYPKWMARQGLIDPTCAREIECMEAIVETLEKLAAAE